ncbi:MAG TPA: LLM class F420-dependent oxidoreductase, partial [Acidimicrobiales bacterium]|nr:LLM class F420-dependent oxidoreductase [Acidimicrobiales bacterium]
MEQRYGMTIPFGAQLSDHKELYEELRDLGYTDLWSSEADGTDAFTPLALAAAWVPEMRLGCAIVPAYTRGPALMAQSVASLAEAAPGRFAFGIGSSSNVIVERWNGIPFDEPYKRTRDTVRFLKTALSGEKVKESYTGFEVSGFKLARRPKVQPQILVAALREGMLKLAGREADGAIINWLSADDVKTVAPIVQKASTDGSEKEICARIFVCPSTDT